MTTLTSQTTVAEVAATRPRSVRVFQQFGIDFCCGGRRPLAEACATAGVGVEALIAEIEAAERVPGGVTRWDQEPVTALIDHIIERFHRPLDSELPRIEAMARRVLAVHGHKDPERLGELMDTIVALRDDLLPHLQKEEMVLFPWLRSGRNGDSTAPIQVMLDEHDRVGTLLQRLRELTDGYVPPPGACGTWRALWQGLEELEAETHEHIHLENNVLFPRVQELRQPSAQG